MEIKGYFTRSECSLHGAPDSWEMYALLLGTKGGT